MSSAAKAKERERKAISAMDKIVLILLAGALGPPVTAVGPVLRQHGSVFALYPLLCILAPPFVFHLEIY